MTEPRAIVQITHNDLDGYGCSTVAAAAVPIARVGHVVRYSDVDAVLAAERERLRGTPAGETLLVTDIGVEPGFAGFMRGFARDNANRASPHRLVVVDHHVSSVDRLRQRGLSVSDGTGPLAGCLVAAPPEQPASAEPWAAPVVVVVDPSRSATRMVRELPFLFGGVREPDAALDLLVAAVDAADLWRRDAEAFQLGEALNEAFWEMSETYVPAGHPMHDPFVSGTLLALCAEAAAGASPDAVEAAGSRVRREVATGLLGRAGFAVPEGVTSRMAMSAYLAAGGGMYVDAGDGLSVCHAVDMGVFQRTSDILLRDGGARVAVNVKRGGQMSFRSRDEDGAALAMASRFGGGGHAQAAGGRLNGESVHDVADAIRRIREVLSPAATAAPGGGALAAALARAGRR